MAFTKINAAGIGTTETVTVDGLTVINDGSFGGNLTVSGVLTYEDVTNVDSVGLITARNGIVVGSGITLSKDGDIFATGVTTSTTFSGNFSGGTVSGTTGTFTGDVDIADKIVHTGDTDTAIRFSGADTVTVETGGSSRFKIDSSGNVTIGNDGDSGSNPSAGFDELCIEGGNEDIGMCFLSPAANDVTQQISFGDSNNNQSGRIVYNHASDHMELYTSNGERLRIDSSGRLLIGTTTEGYTSADDLTVATSGSTGITIRSGTGSLGTIAFSDGTSGSDEYDGYIQYSQNDRYMDFATGGGNIGIRIDSSGRVLIGTTTEGHYDAEDLTIASTGGYTGITLRSDTDQGGAIYFSDATSGAGEYDGQILYSQNSQKMVFATAAGNRLELSDGVSKFAGGRILLGTSTEGHSDADDLTLQSASGYTGITLRAGTTDGGAIYFSDATSGDGEYKGQVLYSHNADKMFIVAGGQTGLEVHSDRNVEITDGNLVIGTSGHGIDFSATSDGGSNGTMGSELFDDYEEGTFVPTFDGFTSIEQQNTEWTGHYTKIGEMVFCDFYARFTNGGATASNGSTIRVVNLPYVIQDTIRVRGGGVTSYQNIASSSHTTDNWSWYGSQSNTYATAYVGSTSVSAPNGTSQQGKYIIGTFNYMST